MLMKSKDIKNLREEASVRPDPMEDVARLPTLSIYDIFRGKGMPVWFEGLHRCQKIFL